MFLSTAQSIPVDIYVLILDYLSVSDLSVLQAAYPDVGQIAQIAKWRSMIRLGNLITQGTPSVNAVIDGERHFYKINRDEPFRQIMLRGRTAKAKPFVPFGGATRFERTFVGGKRDAKMVLSPMDGRDIYTRYAPNDRSGAPKEVVKAEVTFTLGEESLFLEYDTDKVFIPNGETEYIKDDEKHMLRTLSHRVPIISAKWCGRKGGKWETLPTDWMELLGRECFVKVVFMEVIPDGPSLFWNSEANMQSFELFWEMNLHECCASPEVQGIWKTVN
jgi:hypothetical protein